MKLAIFGLTITSSWGNGHATLWRGLCRALTDAGHEVTFFERDMPYYAGARDFHGMPGLRLVLYQNWGEVSRIARREVTEADAAMVTSYCPDGIAATALLGDHDALRVFYDMDTPVTLENLRVGRGLACMGPRGLRDFDLVLSFTGGPVLDELRERLGARRVRTLYGSVDPAVHRFASPRREFSADLSYLGTYAADRQVLLEELFVAPARRLPERKFILAGAQYPHEFPWSENIYFARHLPPEEHAAFLCSSRLTLNVTRRAMRENGWCPSGRLFEAAACGAPIISDVWDGLEEFFEPGVEILRAESREDVIATLELDDVELRRIALAARDRTLAEHTAERRAAELLAMLEEAREPAAAAA
jgi:spore maturation protein CgeB